jgi:hypothetical protein
MVATDKMLYLKQNWEKDSNGKPLPLPTHQTLSYDKMEKSIGLIKNIRSYMGIRKKLKLKFTPYVGEGYKLKSYIADENKNSPYKPYSVFVSFNVNYAKQ